MEVEVAQYAGFTAVTNRTEAGVEVIYRSPSGEELDRELFPEISHYSVKKDHIDTRLKQWGERRGF